MQLHSHQSYLVLTISSQLQRSPLLWPRPWCWVCSTVCCGVLLGRASSHGDLDQEDVSAIQRAFLDCFSNHSAQKSDHRTRVIAAYHSAAGHYHVGSCLEQIWTYSTHGVGETHNIKLIVLKWQVMFVFLTSAHLWMVSGPTPPSTSMSNEGNWLRSQLTWSHTKKKSWKPVQHQFYNTIFRYQLFLKKMRQCCRFNHKCSHREKLRLLDSMNKKFLTWYFLRFWQFNGIWKYFLFLCMSVPISKFVAYSILCQEYKEYKSKSIHRDRSPTFCCSKKPA